MTPEEARDAADLARAPRDCNRVWSRELGLADQHRLMAIVAGSIGLGGLLLGLLFRRYAHETLIVGLGLLMAICL